MADLDAVVVGAGPNGLVAAVALATAGWRVQVVEAAPEPGGGLRTMELGVPGVVHDICATALPLALASPALRDLPLEQHGLAWAQPEIPLAHPLDGGRVGLLHRSFADTCTALGPDAEAYRRMMAPLMAGGQGLVEDLLSPRSLPRHPVALARYGLVGGRSATRLGARFSSAEGQGLLAGLAGHATLPLEAPFTAGYGLLLAALAHQVGWPFARGGSARVAEALVSVLEAHGGEVVCGQPVTSLAELPTARATLLDLTPRQVVAVAGERLPDRYRRRLERFRYGPGVWKVDWVLDGPVPWTSPAVGRAGTVHLGGTLAEIAQAEAEVARGHHPLRPFVILTQPSVVDPTRASGGRHAVWAYCHVPNGSTVDVTAAIEAQVERFAPGFADRVVARHVMGPRAMEEHDANHVGGDIAGGAGDWRQLLSRPVLGLHPWRTPVPGLYLCSSSTPPGGGVHGMCGWLAAHEVLRAA